MSVSLHFPSEKDIYAYVDKHPSTRYKSSLKIREKIIKSVAKFFSGKEVKSNDIDDKVMETMLKLNADFKLPRIVLLVIKSDLSIALKDCANGKSLSAPTNVIQAKL